MKLCRIRRMLIATVPLTVAILGLTAGTASALPRSSYCQEISDQARSYYEEGLAWETLANIDNNAGRYRQADAEFLVRDDAINSFYAELAMSVAYGC